MAEDKIVWATGGSTSKLGAVLDENGLRIRNCHLQHLGDDIKMVDIGYNKSNDTIVIRKGTSFNVRRLKAIKNYVPLVIVGGRTLARFIYSHILELDKHGRIPFNPADISCENGMLVLHINVPVALRKVA